MARFPDRREFGTFLVLSGNSAMATKPPESPAGFEASMEALESLVSRMEAGDLPLEESLREYQRGMELIRACQNALDEAQRKIEILADGTPPLASAGYDSNDTTKVPDIPDSDDVPF
jgi:exodeoxyribonuclease VII small subunit